MEGPEDPRTRCTNTIANSSLKSPYSLENIPQTRIFVISGLKMVKGSCMCGGVTYELSGRPVSSVICHCRSCQKNAGANGSTNILVKDDQYKQLSGEIRTWTRPGDSGKNVTYKSCATCPTIMTVHPEAFQGMVIVKTGTLDSSDQEEVNMATCRPGAEFYVKDRVEWCGPMPGAEQKQVM
ncbi:Mss4-like protein [Xylariomycetidae sp. FL0641]|nr:Mss4-like protein [Xylariomycetidae sp. FL0641]